MSMPSSVQSAQGIYTSMFLNVYFAICSFFFFSRTFVYFAIVPLAFIYSTVDSDRFENVVGQFIVDQKRLHFIFFIAGVEHEQKNTQITTTTLKKISINAINKEKMIVIKRNNKQMKLYKCAIKSFFFFRFVLIIHRIKRKHRKPNGFIIWIKPHRSSTEIHICNYRM